MSTITATILATRTVQSLDADGMAVSRATFARLCRESSHPALGQPDELHITTNTDDAMALVMLDDELRERSRALTEFAGSECYALFIGEGIDGCDVWARVAVESVAD